MGRTPCCDRNGLKKGPWTAEEDQKLVDYIQKHGQGNWRTLPKNAGLQRCGKSCRLRWTNYLRPDIKRGRFSFEEEETIIQLHSILGNKWSAIAARLPGRTDNEIKNYWNTHIRKRFLRIGIDPVTHSPRFDVLDVSSLLSSSQVNLSRLIGMQNVVNPEMLRLATNLFSSQHENPEFILQNLQENQLCNPQLQYSFFQPNELENPIQEFQACTTSSTHYAPFLDETQLMQTNEDQFQTDSTRLNYQNSQPNAWGDNIDAVKNCASTPNDGYYCSNQVVAPSDYSSPIFNFRSVLSTASSSPNPLDSSSTHLNSSIEDVRDTYGSDVLKFELPSIFDVNEFI